MRRFRILALAAAACLFIGHAASAQNPNYKPDHKALAADDHVLVILKGLSDAKHFDEQGARQFVPALLEDGLTPDEQDLFYEIVNARTPVEITSLDRHMFELPPPDGAARDYLLLLKQVLESNMLEGFLDARWMKGAQPMKDVVDISTMGTTLNQGLTGYVARKLAPAYMASNDANGFQPLKDEIAEVDRQLAMDDAATERSGKALMAAGIKALERNMGMPVPIEIYNSLNR
jgi:hypothetical protein